MFSEAHEYDVQEFSLDENGPDLPLSDNFTLGEFACNDGSDTILIHPYLVALLQVLRDNFGPVHINSAYRTKEYNKAIGGSAKSRHVMGMAADVVCVGHSPDEVYEFLDEYDPGGLGRYNTFTHVDVQGSFRRWDNRT